MTRIMFELKTEEMGGKGCKMWSVIIYTACRIMGYQITVEKWVRNVAWMGMRVIVQIFFYLENGKERVHSEDLCEYGRIILKWILHNFMNGFCLFGSVVNDIPMNYVISCMFHKILGNILISRATSFIPENTVYWIA